MKAVIICLTMLVSSAAWGCPQLTGNYHCEDERSGSMKTFIKQAKVGRKTEYRYRFEGNSLLGDEESRIPVPYRWRQEKTIFTSACKGQAFVLTESALDHSGKRFDIVYRFEKSGENSLRFSVGYESLLVFDYHCQR